MVVECAASNSSEVEVETDLVRQAQADLRHISPPCSEPFSSQAWEWLYLTYRPLIYRVVRACRLPEAEVEDCVQEVWMAVVRRIPEFDADPRHGRLCSWLAALARHKAIDRLRRQRREARASLDEPHPEDYAREMDPAEICERQWQIATVRLALADLRRRVPADNYQIVCLHWLEGRSMAEVAAELGLRFEQVRSRYQRLQQKLRRLLEARGLGRLREVPAAPDTLVGRVRKKQEFSMHSCR